MLSVLLEEKILHSEPLHETSTVETLCTRPDSVAQNAFTANKTHVSDTRCSARQCDAREYLPARFPGLPLTLLETSNQHLEETLFRVPPMVTHVGQNQFVHNWTAQASNANQVLLPTREGLIHLFFRNQQGTVPEMLRLNDACPSDATSAHTLPPESSSRATLGVDGPIRGIAVVVPILVLFRRGQKPTSVSEITDRLNDSCPIRLHQCAHTSSATLGVWLSSVATAKELIHGNLTREVIPRTESGSVHGKRKDSHPKRCTEPWENRRRLRELYSSKQHSTRITQAVIQASRLLTSGLLFGLVGRDQRPARRTWVTWTWSKVTG